MNCRYLVVYLLVGLTILFVISMILKEYCGFPGIVTGVVGAVWCFALMFSEELYYRWNKP